MRLLVVFVLLITYASTVPVSDGDEPPFATHVESLSDTEPSSITSVDSITYWYFSKEDPYNGVPLNKYTVKTLENTSFTLSRATIFMVHGWQNTNTSSFATTVRSAILASSDSNLFYVDWSIIADQSYVTAKASVKAVGGALAEFINTLEVKLQLSLSNLTLVGHSLGAHVVGATGAALGGEVAAIVGLDPALPLFLASDIHDRLDATDAKFVQGIHTNGGLKGILIPIGHADYYPNGGRKQPGCGTDRLGSCSHNRAHEFYAESLITGNFIGVSCSSEAMFAAGYCQLNDTSVMGTYHLDPSASGRYYLSTDDRSPFALG